MSGPGLAGADWRDSPEDGPVIRVLCVEDNYLVASALRRCIDREPGLRCVGVVASADNIREEVRATEPHVLLIDRGLPGRDAIEAIAELSEAFPDVRSVVLSGSIRPADVEGALAAGAIGYLTKGEPPDEIVAALRRAATGESVFSSDALRSLRR